MVIFILVVVVELYAKQLKKLNTDQLKDRLKQKDKPYMLIDARDIEAYYKGHIPGACSMFDGEIMSKAKNFDKNMSGHRLWAGQRKQDKAVRRCGREVHEHGVQERLRIREWPGRMGRRREPG